MPDQPDADAAREARRQELFAARTASRISLITRLDDEDASDLADKLRKCGERLELVCVCCGRTSVVLKRCDNKWCPNCAPLLAFRAVERFTPVAKEMHWPLFVTFRVKNWCDRVGLRELRRAFTKFRRLRWWKKRVRGGVAMFEVSRLSDIERKKRRLGPRVGTGWHPHVHALLDCHWLSVTSSRPPAGTSKPKWDAAVLAAMNEVAEQWTLCLGRPGSLNVRATFKTDNGDPTRGLRETLKYSMSPDVLQTTDGAIAPLIRELLLTRNLVTWGTLYHNPLLRKSKGVPCACECGAIGDRMPADIMTRFSDQARADARRDERAALARQNAALTAKHRADAKRK